MTLRHFMRLVLQLATLGLTLLLPALGRLNGNIHHVVELPVRSQTPASSDESLCWRWDPELDEPCGLSQRACWLSKFSVRSDCVLRNSDLRNRPLFVGVSIPRRSDSATTALSEDDNGDAKGPGMSLDMDLLDNVEGLLIFEGVSVAVSSSSSAGNRTFKLLNEKISDDVVLSIETRLGERSDLSRAVAQESQRAEEPRGDVDTIEKYVEWSSDLRRLCVFRGLSRGGCVDERDSRLQSIF